MLSGIFNTDDDKEDVSASSGDETDEILAELKKKQAELRALSHQNAIMLRHLHKQAKEEFHSQELKKKMAAADAEVNTRDCTFCYPLHSGLCYHKSVCLSSVTFIRPTQLLKVSAILLCLFVP